MYHFEKIRAVRLIFKVQQHLIYGEGKIYYAMKHLF